MMQTPFLQIGTVLRPHGLQGQLRIRLHNPTSCALDMVQSIWLRLSASGAASLRRGEEQREWKLDAVRALPDGCYLVSLDGVADRTAADALRTAEVLVPREALGELAENEVYLADLVGMSVRTGAGENLGRVREVLHLNSNSLLSIARPGRPDLLLPTVEEILKHVDWAEGLVVVEPPDGLLDS
jgi:16S rRNA processing protein RimM